MEELLEMLHSIIPANFDYASFFRAALLLCGGSLILGLLGRMIFGKRSVLNQSVSSAIGILFIYAATVAIYSYGVDLAFLLSPLPFIELHGEYLHIFSFASNDYTIICNQVLSMVILAFLANLANSWLPIGKNIFSWLLFRILSVALAMAMHVVVNYLLNLWLPDGFLTWAPVILLGLLVLMLAVGALKFIIGALISTVNPLIAALYTFFFASMIGKMLSKAVLTTLIISGLIFGLNYLGVSVVFIGSAALAAYLPLIIILLILWFVIGHLL